MVKANSLFSVDTEYSADSTEFCPFQNKAQYLACGTYQLYNHEEQKNEQPAENDTPMQRKGRLYLYKQEDNDQGINL
jgi:diphthamide biosynthesis protein 7